VTQFATLVVGRVKYRAVKVTDGGTLRYVKSDEAGSEYYRCNVLEPAKKKEADEENTYRRQVKTFNESLTINPGIEIKRDIGKMKRARVLIDEVIIGTKRYMPDAGTGEAFVADLRKKACPEPSREPVPNFDQWFKTNSTEHRSWAAAFLDSAHELSIDLPADVNYAWGFPSIVVHGLLERFTTEGWRLVHVSEDRGLYEGADARNESYPARVRYLLEKRNSQDLWLGPTH